MVMDRWGDPVDPEKLEAAIKEHPDARLLLSFMLRHPPVSERR